MVLKGAHCMRTVAIVTNNVECDELSNYYAKIERYFTINGWKSTNTLDADLILLVACGTVNLMHDRIKHVLEKIYELKGNYRSTIILGCQTITFREALEKVFDGQMIRYNEMPLLDERIGATIKFADIKNSHVFNSPKQKRDNNKNKLFTIVISNGCLMKCTYCIIKKAHGYLKSKTVEEVCNELKIAKRNGYHYIALGGVDTSVYGYDIGTNLIHLIKELIKVDDSIRLYIDNLHPRHLITYQKDFLELAKSNVLEYLHIPFQHVDERILKEMGREADFTQTYDLIKSIKEVAPHVVLFTDFICGFPGETEEEFNKLAEFVKTDECFNYYYLNEYCDIKGTVSSLMTNKIAPQITSKRWKKLLEIFEPRKEMKKRETDASIYERIRHRYNIHEELDRDDPRGYYFCYESYELIND
ncbi:radical SAM protein [Porphyromonas gingivalis]|nr:radical SAM protein [Porphyromonas gingivalis]AIJ35238.1 hypothetical protein EG14_03970 [Porphyromonas gingivalis]